jgi:hypothetical protein
LNSRERIIRALNHQSGPVPFDMGAFPTTGIHIRTMENLREYYGLEKKIPKVIEPFQMLGMVEDDLREAIGIDTVPLWSQGTMFGFKNEKWKEWTTPWGQKILVPGEFNTSCDKEKVYLYAGGDLDYPPAGIMPKSGYFFDSVIRQKPIDDDNLNPDDNLEEFTAITDSDLEYYKTMKRKMQDSPYFIAGNLGGTGIGDIACVPGPMLKEPKGIRDVEEWYVSTIIRRDYLHEVFTRQTEIALKNLEKIYAIMGDTISVVYICGTDFGTQISTFCSVNTFRELYAPYYKKINHWIHQNTNWKTFKHCCGAIESFLGEFIDVEFDIINPVQWTAAGMDRKYIKNTYGKNLVFWGGGIDTQKTLPFGTPDEVRREVIETCEIFSEDGGFVFNTVHNIQACTPIENLVAMIEALREFNRGR